MPPRLRILGALRALSIQPRPQIQQMYPRLAIPIRNLSDTTAIPQSIQRQGDDLGPPDSKYSLGPYDIQLPRDAHELQAKLPQDGEVAFDTMPNAQALRDLELIAHGLDPSDTAVAQHVTGNKFPLPTLPLSSDMNMKDRYDPVVVQLTNLLMRSGKKSKAQKVSWAPFPIKLVLCWPLADIENQDMAMILNFLRTSPPPKINPARPLLPGSPAPSHLPLNPVLYLTLAIDSVAPLVRIRSMRGLAGGGASLDVPMPLAVRQRRRTAFMWILGVVNKKKSVGSGRAQFPHRVAQEIIAVVEGRSSVWERRHLVHKLGTSARANLNHQALRRRK